MKKQRFQTKAVRTKVESSQYGEFSSPIYMTSGYQFEDAEDARARFTGEKDDNIYSRYSNPSVSEFILKLATLEGAEDGIGTSSGMAAVFGTLAGLLNAGDHFIASRSLFGSTVSVINQILPRWNISASLVDPANPDSWTSQVTSKTKLFYLETPTNPVLDVIDLELVSEFCKKHHLIMVVDNCFASPYVQQPITWGADIVLHSATKYIDGQGRSMGGAILGKPELLEPIRFFCRQTGPALSPFNAWILSKSLETLPVRMRAHSESALEIAKRLEAHPMVNWVKYPHLPSHPAYQVGIKQMKTGGGMVAFEVKGGIEQGRKFLDSLELMSLVANLGDSRSIATHPASTTHSKLTEQERLAANITNGSIRLSIGLEDVEDIWDDLQQALQQK